MRTTPLLGMIGMSLALVSSGCQSSFTVSQGDYINTGAHVNRAKPQRTGEPLELNIVCVTEKDLKNQANELLRPGSSLTADVWFQRRPLPGDHSKTADRGLRFWLPKSQVCLFTNDKDAYGTIVGTALRGSVTDGFSEAAIPLPSSCAVLYAFPRFTGPDGKVLPVPPARWESSGSSGGSRRLRIWWDKNDDSSPCFGQHVAIEGDSGS